VAALLLLHAALALWGMARNSVTFDENFHLPAGVVEITKRRFDVSPVNPPLVKALAGAAALAAGARPPADSAIALREQSIVGESFMRRNADRYHRVFFAGRLVTLVLSLVLGLLVWRFARRLHGARGGALALAFYAFAPEALAHAGFVTMDLATALGFFASAYAWWRFARSGRWSWWAAAAAAIAFTVLVRHTAFLLAPILLAMGLALDLGGRVRRPRRLWLGFAMLPAVALVALAVGYLGQIDLRPLGERTVLSERFRALQLAAPGLRLPLPDAWLTGLDFMSYESSEEDTPTFLLGRVTNERVWWYAPFALLVKWPLGFLGGLALLLGRIARRARPRRVEAAAVLLPPALYLLATMTLANLNVGVRYLLPMLPFLCVALGALARPALGRTTRTRHRWLAAAVALAALQTVEAVTAAPFYVAFYNLPAGGPGGGYRLVNDSNVDWGQGLIDLRDHLRRRGIGRIQLLYHGSTDPGVYGIDYVPFQGERLSRDSEWLAVSSYFFVGQAQRQMTPQGFTPFFAVDFSPLRNERPAAVVGRSIYLFHLPELFRGQ
jgi:4-amino-4-deoxy-L-arabinose transferase-like glycosyltransferase